MKIGFLTERMILGYGVDLVTDKLAEGLSRKGHEVTVYCSFQDDTFAGGNYALKALNVPASRRPPDYEVRAEKAIEEYVSDEDLWIVETFPFFKAASRFEKPWIAIDYGVVPSRPFSRKIRKYFDYIRRTQYGEYFESSSKIICISNFLRQCLPDRLKQKSSVVYPAVDHYDKKILIDLRRELNLRGTTLLYQGRSSDTSRYKGVDLLLEAYAKLRSETDDVQLLISTSCSAEEQARLERNGAVVLNGVLMQFVPSVYQCADVFATATQWEGFDLPLLEAGYFGLPVVAFAIGAHAEIVRDGQTGYLVREKNEFLTRTKQLVDDARLRKEMGDAGSSFASRFKWKDTVEAFEQIVKDTYKEAMRSAR